jgi:hypothetical protein
MKHKVVGPRPVSVSVFPAGQIAGTLAGAVEPFVVFGFGISLQSRVSFSLVHRTKAFLAFIINQPSTCISKDE